MVSVLNKKKNEIFNRSGEVEQIKDEMGINEYLGVLLQILRTFGDKMA